MPGYLFHFVNLTHIVIVNIVHIMESQYRIKSSIIEGQPAVQAAFRARGIQDYCNALIPDSGGRCTQVFVLESGEIVPARSEVTADVAREVSMGLAA